MTRIVPRQEEFRISYQQECLADVFFQQDSDADFSDALSLVDSQQLAQIVDDARQTLLLACDQLKDSKVIDALRKQADKGLRIYLLLGNEQKNQLTIEALSGRCLIRCGVAQQGVLLIRDHATTKAHGLLLTSIAPVLSSQNEGWAIGLESQQIDDSFRSFCKLFWEETSAEYLKQNNRQSSVANPDGSIITNHSYQLHGKLLDGLSDTLPTISAISNNDFVVQAVESRILLNSNSNLIRDKAREGVTLSDRYIPSLLFSNEHCWLLPDTTDLASVNWCLKLSYSQSLRLIEAYNRAVKLAAWQFLPAIEMQKLPAQQRLKFADQVELICTVEQVRNISLPDIHAQSIESFLKDDAEKLASSLTQLQRELLAQYIDYSVNIFPPFCPDDALRDELYTKWDESESEWLVQLDTLVSLQQKIDQKQAGIADTLRGFIKGFLLGQGQSMKSLNQEISALKNWSVIKASPAERELHRDHLIELQNRIIQRGEDTQQKIDEANQNQAWEQKSAELKMSLDDKLKAVKQRKTTLSDLELNKAESALNIRNGFQIAWSQIAQQLNHQQLESIELEKIALTDFMPSSMPEDIDERQSIEQLAAQQFYQAKKQAIEAMSSEDASKWKASFKEKIWKKHYRDFDRVLADYHEGLKKLERDIQDVKDAVERSQREYQQVQSAIDEHGASFKFQPIKAEDAFAKQLGITCNRRIIKNEFSWPDEELPADMTELRWDGENRFLVLFDTDHLQQALIDAERLNAQLVCDRRIVHA
ncbi:hypothetical protein [Shewanella sp. KCT]|uniref:hypothetical protein n=1 Tax=Shewanella sp. KCT TaxID=2569535 RepID=UPI001183CF20|nr:hypothetical protein [Shewanella sp. KCT]TVP12289.1 hypothetical protein AYI87_14765 [Shewanella sp. KCT]